MFIFICTFIHVYMFLKTHLNMQKYIHNTKLWKELMQVNKTIQNIQAMYIFVYLDIFTYILNNGKSKCKNNNLGV